MPPILGKKIADVDVGRSNKACKALFKDVTEILVETKKIRFNDPFRDFPLANNKLVVSTYYFKDTVQAQGKHVEADRKGKGKVVGSFTTTYVNKELVVDACLKGSLEADGELGAVVVVRKERDAMVAFGVAVAKATSIQQLIKQS